MELNKYQLMAMRTKGNKVFESKLEQIVCASMGLAGEAGEVVDYIKKVNWHGHEFNKNKLAEEIGDVLWYVALMCDAIGISMDEVAEGNIAKLQERYPLGFDPERSKNRKAAE